MRVLAVNREEGKFEFFPNRGMTLSTIRGYIGDDACKNIIKLGNGDSIVIYMSRELQSSTKPPTLILHKGSKDQLKVKGKVLIVGYDTLTGVIEDLTEDTINYLVRGTSIIKTGINDLGTLELNMPKIS